MQNSRSSSYFRASVSAGALAVALVAAAAPAKAADQCGAPTGGVVECDSSDAPFPTGIEYFVGDNLTVNVEDGLTVAPDPLYAGIVVSSSNGSVVINASGADVTTEDAGAIGVFAAGDLTVAIDDVSTTGTGAWGITTFSAGGDTVIEADTVTTNGDYALGIIAESTTGNITVSANSIDTTGFAADGVTARGGGDINVEVGSIEGEGDYLWGVNAVSGNYVDGQIVYGDINVDVGSIEITGDHAIGVSAVGYGAVDVTVDSIMISGDYGTGVVAIGVDDVNVEVGDAVFTGNYTGGIVAFSYGNASVKVGTLTTENGGGVVAFGVEGAYAQADKIVTNGDFGNGIQSVSMYGDATLKVGEVSTNGFFAIAVNGDAMKGDLVIEAGKITTQGDLAMGIRAFGRTSSITVTGPISTDGDTAFGILNSTLHGDAIVRTQGTISTTGVYADAMMITSRYGTADIKADGKITTTGDDSRGINAVGEDGQVKIVANEVETSGAGSDGIQARTRYVEFFLGMPSEPEPVDFTGNIDIKVETVKVTGTGSTGISARGLGAATIEVGTVSAFDSYAIETLMIEDASITVKKAATSTQGSAILAGGEDVTVNVASGATVSGGEHGIIIEANGDRCVERNPVDGGPNPCPNPGDTWNFEDRDTFPIDETVAPGTAVINNAGTIKGGTGYAVLVERGTLTLNNSGTIMGGLLLSDGDDVVNNTGIFIVDKDSDFGAGTDLFKNSGTVKFATATTPKFFAFLNLEKFENSGTVDLRSGVAGDSFTLSGAYVGSGNATLGLDVNFTTGTADKFVVQGAATGSTQIALGLTADTARLTSPAGITLVEVGTGSAANAFKLATEELGFIRYGLAYDAATRRYLLQGVAGSGAYRQLNVFDGALGAWHASAEAWRTNDASNREAQWATRRGTKAPRNRFWAEVYGDVGKRDAETNVTVGGADQVIDYSYKRHRIGGQIGYDFTGSQHDNGDFRAGLTGGYASETLEARDIDDEITLDTFNIGAYASVTTGLLFGSVLAKYDGHAIEFDAAGTGFSEDSDGSTWGIEVQGGAQFGDSTFFLEPVASLAWTRTNLDDVEALGQALDFDARDGVRGKIGANFGGRSDLGNGSALVFFGSAKAVHDFGGRHRLTLVNGSLSEEISAERLKTFAEGIFRASYLTGSGFEGFVQAQGELGSGHESIGGSAGIRINF
jgi:outer membrane autotransporter protein